MKDIDTPSSGLFVIGTDTEVGKTVVSAVLVGLLHRRGVAAGWLKPLGAGAVETPEGPASPDAVFVKERTGLSQPYAELCPVLAQAPAAPAQALSLEGRELDWEGLKALCRQRLQGGPLIVEGVGGLLVPIGAGRLLSDLAVELNLPCLVVARPGLGTINHTLLTLRELDRLGLTVAGFLFSGPGQPEAAQANAEWISRFHPARFRGWLPEGLEMDWDQFLYLAEESLDLTDLPGFD